MTIGIIVRGFTGFRYLYMHPPIPKIYIHTCAPVMPFFFFISFMYLNYLYTLLAVYIQSKSYIINDIRFAFSPNNDGYERIMISALIPWW